MARLAALGAVLLAALPACGNSVLHDLATPYVADWLIASGTDTEDCGNGPMEPTPVAGSVIVDFAGIPGGLSVRDTNHGTCIWFLKASSVGATLREGEACQVTTNGPAAGVLPREYLLVIAGENLEEPGAATVDSVFDWDVLDQACRHTQHESLLRVTSAAASVGDGRARIGGGIEPSMGGQ